MPTPAAATGSDSPKARDDTTRFLCGAAHRDEEFTDSAIRDYLVKATRTIPRSPGVNYSVLLVLALVLLPLDERAQQTSPHARAPLVLGTAAGMIALLFVLHKFTAELCTSDRYSSSYYEGYEPRSGSGALVVAIALVFAARARTGTVKVSTAKESR